MHVLALCLRANRLDNGLGQLLRHGLLLLRHLLSLFQHGLERQNQRAAEEHAEPASEMMIWTTAFAGKVRPDEQ